MKSVHLLLRLVVLASFVTNCARANAGAGVALVRHAPTINSGTVDGSLQQMLGEPLTLSGGTVITGDALVPGTPLVRVNGQTAAIPIVDGAGSSLPANYQVTLNGRARVRSILRRTDPVALPALPAPPSPVGARRVRISAANETPGDFSTLRDLTLQGGVGQVAVPPGTYGDFAAEGGSGFTLGVVGSTSPTLYHFQRLTLNGPARVQVVGPVILNVAYGFFANGVIGNAERPDWLTLHIYSGGLTLDGRGALHGFVNVPNGTVIVGGNSELVGGVACDRLTLNGDGVLRLIRGESSNRAPVAVPSAALVIEDTATTLVLTADDSDGDALRYAIVSPPAHGTLGPIVPRPNRTATVAYTPGLNLTSPTVFTFKASDGAQDSNVAAFSLSIVPVNDGPVAGAKRVAAVEDVSAEIVLSGEDADGDVLTFDVVAPPLYGILSGTGPTRTYTPRVDFNGTDVFTYVARDGALTSAAATVTITVEPVNDAPVALESSHSVNEGAVVAFTLAAIDPEGDTLTFERLSEPAHGTISGSGTQFAYAPQANFSGVDHITFRAFDGQLQSAAAAVTFKVTDLNFAPVAYARTLTSSEDGSVAIPLVATDQDGHAVTYVIVVPPSNGSLGLVTTGADATAWVVYSPSENFSGVDTFTFKARDVLAADSNTATITVNVLPVNDAPVAPDQTVQTDEDTSVSIALTASDVEQSPLQFAVSIAPQHGTLSAIVLGGSSSATVVYTPRENYHGVDTFTFVAHDGDAVSVAATVTLNVRAVNDAPVAVAQNQSTAEEQSRVLTLTGLDVENGALTFAIVAPPRHGTLGPVEVGLNQTASVTYTPALDYFGLDSFTFKTHDGERESEPAQVSVAVTPVNDAPVATNQSLVQVQDTPFDFTLSAYDVDGDALTYAVTPPSRGMITGTLPNLHYTPVPGETGTLSLRFTASDGLVASNEGTITFTLTAPPNRPPVFASAPVTTFELRGESGGSGMLRGTIRDFSKQHPNFEHYNASSTQVSTNVVGVWLGDDRKPVPGMLGGLSSTDTAANFNQWYRDVPGINYSRSIDLPVSETAPGSGRFAFRSDTFFPIDNEFFGSEGLTDGVAPHNFNFTCEFHSQFIYQPGQTIMFGGDDSIWVFVADRRVIDLGGVHLPVEQTTSLDHLGLIPGKVYPIDIFYAEQHTGGASFRFTTNFGFATQQAYEYKAVATDPDGEVVVYSLLQGPPGMTVDAQTGAITWLVGGTDVGAYPIVLQARDAAGLTAEQSFTVNVFTNRPPVLAVENRFLSGTVGLPIPLVGQVTDDGQPSGTTLTTSWTVVSGPGTAQFQNAAAVSTTATFALSGLYVLQLDASDGRRDTATTLEVRVDQITSLSREPSLVSWWPANRSAEDFVGQHHAALYFGANYEPGKVGEAFRFDGVDDVARVSATPDLNVGAASEGFTIEFWVRCDEPNPQAILLAWQSKAGELGLRLTFDYYYSPRLVLDIPTTSGASVGFQFNDMWAAGQWSHVAVSYDRVAGLIRVYRDGIIKGEERVGQIIAKTTDDLWWGTVHRQNGPPFRGAMDEIAIHRAPVSPQRIYATYAAGAVGRQPPDGNRAPVVSAGPDLILAENAAATLTGSVVDDGTPSGLPLRARWRMLDGPGVVDFTSATLATTSASFPAAGTYVLQLTANDGAASAEDTVVARVGVTTGFAPADLAAWWPGNGDGREVIRGSHDLELINGAGYAAGKVAQGFTFDGINGYGRVAAHPDLDVGASAKGMSVEFWVKNDGASGAQDLVQWRSGTQRGVTLGTSMYFGVPRLSAMFYDTAGNSHRLQTHTAPLQVGGWEHVVFTYEKSTGEAYVYRNGLIEGAEVVDLGVFIPGTHLDLIIGQAHPLTPFRTTLDELTLYSRALRAPEVQALFTAGAAGKHPPSGNTPPVVSAGADLVFPGASASATLNGSVTDDQLPFGAPAVQWSVVSGPGAVTFNSPTTPTTTATFASPGLYVLSLSASDAFTPPVADLVQVRVGSTPIPAAPGLSAWWPLNGDSNEALQGISSFELINGPTFVNGTVAQALSLDGSDDAARTRAHPSLDLGSSVLGFTIEFWVRPGGPLEADWPLLAWDGSGKRGVEVVVGAFFSDRRADLVIRDVADGARTLNGPTLNGREGQWSHLAYTYDRLTGTARAYLNGGIVTETNLGISWTARTNVDLWLGSRRDNRKFKGVFDEISLYGRPLTIEDVRAIHAAGADGKSSASENMAPTVNAGPDVALAAPGNSADLNGSATDDGKPFGALSLQWTTVFGPGTVLWGTPTASATTALFDTPGTYLLKLTAADGFAPAVFDLTEVRVAAASTVTPGGQTAWWSANGHGRELIKGNHDIELGNGAGYAPGKVLLGVALDGVDDFARVPRHADLDIGASPGGFTIEFWVKADSYIQGSALLAWNDSAVSGLEVGLQSYFGTRRIDWAIHDLGGGVRQLAGATMNGREGQWIHLACTYDRITGIARAYDNGLIVTESNLGNNWVARTNLDLWFGSRFSNRQFKGTLDEVSLYSRPLAYSEIGDIYRAGADGKTNSADNRPPTVDAGPDQVIGSITTAAALTGIVADDNKPFGAAVAQWSKVEGPGSVAFLDPMAPNTAATFGSPGLYLLQLSATDRITAAVSDLMEVHVANSSITAPSGVVAWWTGNGHARDRIGGHDLRFLNHPGFAAGRVLQALDFDGKAYASAAASPSLDVGQSSAGFSIEFWIKNRLLGNNHPLVGWAANGTVGVQVVTANGFGTTYLQANIRDTIGGDHIVNGPAIAASLGQWLHIGLSFERSTGTARLYYNGVLVTSANLGAGWAPQTSHDLWLGSLPDNRQFNGALDEVTLYNRPLSGVEMAAIHAAAADGKRPPAVNQSPIANAGADQTTEVQVPAVLAGTATDDGLPNPPAALTYQWAKVSGPGLLTLANATAATTTATFSLAGSYVVSLTVNDSEKTHRDEVSVRVLSAPWVAITSPVNNSIHPTGAELAVVAEATDTDGTVAKVEFYRDGLRLGEALTAPYRFVVNAGLPVGSTVLTAKATDNSGLITTSAPVTVTITAGGVGPFAQIASPSEDARITQPAALTGIVASSSLASWSAQYRLKSADLAPVEPWTQFAMGTTAVGTPPAGSNPGLPGALGTFDPTQLLNGIYELQLRVTDTGGMTAIAGPIPLVIEGNMKIGAFTLAFEDLKVPIAGIPITLTRTYDSRDTRVGDFGPGWRLALNNIRVQKNRQLGNDWWQTPQSGSGIQFYDVLPQRDRIVTVVLPDGETHRFKAGALVKNRIGDPDYRSFAVVVTRGKYRFYPIGDTTATLEPLNVANQLADDFYIGGTNQQDLTFDPFGFEPFTTSRYRLTTTDGTSLVLDEALGLLEMRDLNGNLLVLNRDAANRVTGVTSTQNTVGGSTTTRVSILRDAAGRIDAIQDPNGKELDYVYDDQGRLSASVNREGNVTQFRYENTAFPRYLTRIIDPRGVSALRSEYDAAGKLVKQIDADGKETVFDRGIESNGRFERITNRLGQATTFYYDERGNVTLKVDPMGAQTRYQYWADSDRVKFQTDHYGTVTSTAYDVQGNATVHTVGASSTEAPENPSSGYISRTSYSARGGPTQTIDPDGRVQTFIYDAATNNVLTHTAGADVGNAAVGDRTTYTYHADGTINTITDALGNVTSHTYAYGFANPAYLNAIKSTIVTVTDPAGSAGSNRTNPAPIIVRSTRSLFDSQENQVAQITPRYLPDGSSEDVITRFVYDAENRRRATLFPDGQVREIRYNAFGKEEKALQWKTTAEYQAMPQDESKARVTTYAYDARGNQVLVTQADGTSEGAGYDAENRRVWSQDRRGHRTFNVYDAVGRQRFTIHPDTNDGQAAAAPSTVTDARLADNPRSETQYDLLGRVRFQIDPRGAKTEFVYENGVGSSSWRKQSIQHHASGNLISLFQYDRTGNVRFVTDPRGYTTETIYDVQGRPARIIHPSTDEHPATESETRYDGLGRRIALVDQEGKITRYGYDAVGRLTEVRQYLDGGLAASDADLTLSPNSPGVASTRYSYDALGHQQQQVDALGRATTYWTDSSGRRTRRILPKDTAEPVALVETLIYDGWGNLTQRTDFAGRSTTYTYDVLNRLTSKSADPGHPSLAYSHAVARVEFDYDANGSRQAARTYRAGGGMLYSEATPRDERGRLARKDTAAGRLDYRYYSNGLLRDVVSSNSSGVNLGYRYDDLNRLAGVDDASTSLPTRTTSYAYNANGSLATVTQPNAVLHSYSYDSLNRLRTLGVASATEAVHSYAYKLRRSGQRQQVMEGAKTTTYTYDELNRLTAEAIAGGATGLNGSVSYGLDKVGNRLSRTSQLAGVSTQTGRAYNARDWLYGDSVSPNGSTVLSPDFAMSNPQAAGADVYDFEERLILRTRTDGSTVHLSYDADGYRIGKTTLSITALPIASTLWLVDTNNLTGYAQVVEEQVATASGTTRRTYTYGSDLISQATSVNAQPWEHRYFAYDGHGSTRELTDQTGAVTDRYDYDAFGVLTRKTGVTANSYLYCGEQFDADLGLYYLRARYLNPDSGRFWTMDGYEGRGRDPASLHKYSYAHGDPVGLTDPSGMSPLLQTLAAQITANVMQSLATVRVSFLFGAAAGGAALRNLGMAVENGAFGLLQSGGAQITQGIRITGSAGPRIIDMMARIGERVALIEVKFKLPSRAGSQLDRLVSQMTAATEATTGKGQQVVLYTFKEPQLAQLQLIHDKLGERALTIQYVSGFDGLVRWMNFYFSIDG